MKDCLADLKARGLIHDVTHADKLAAALNSKSLTFYCGFDPTADSLHVGSLLPLITMKRLAMLGHTPIALMGAATGMIGDPSGKSAERSLLGIDTIQRNVKGIEKQVRNIFQDCASTLKVLRNDEWLGKISYLDFLRDVGKHFSVNAMMAKDSVRSRLEDRDQGISYTEFSYMLLQAYDFYQLHQQHNCQLQIGGSDQWGNITAGIDFIRRKTGQDENAFGFTIPLLTTAAGGKFGKTEEGNIWLSAERTSPYNFYQFWLNTEDADVIKFLNYFTFIQKDELQEIAQQLKTAPEKRLAQRRLAAEMTTLVHGAAETKKAEQAAQVLFGSSIDNISEDILLEIFADVPSSEITSSELQAGISIIDLLARTGLVKSKGEARKLITNGGAYLNNIKVTEIDLTVGAAQLASQSALLLRSGKKNYHLIRVK